MQLEHLYEKKIIQNGEFPVQTFANDVRRKGWYFTPHWHEHIEMHYVWEGSTILRLNQTDILAREGDLVIANSNELHAGYCDGSPVRTSGIIFEMEAISKELADQNILFRPYIQGDETVRQLMSLICQEQQEERLGYQLVCKGAVLQLMVYLTREYAEEMLTNQESEKRKKRLERLNTVLEYIQEHYTEPIGNQQLSQVICLSEDRFNHLFKESMGMAPLQYINEVRLKKALHLLKHREGTVTEVAAMVGFTDYNHFGRLFRRYYGCAPSEVVRKQSDPLKTENK